MVEFWLLTKIGIVIDAVVKTGYAVAGAYAVRTGMKYYSDYKYSIEQEKVEVK